MAAHLAYAPTPSNHLYNRPPRPPPSPPMEDTRCSLPSISNLLGLADAGSPTTDPSPVSYRSSPQSEAPLSYPHSQSRRESGGVGSRPSSRHSGVYQHRRGLPPTPPLSTDTAFDSYNSPSSQARGHFPFDSSSNGRYHETTPPIEPEAHRHHVQAPVRAPQLSIPVPPQHQYAPTPAPLPHAVPGYYGAPGSSAIMGQGQSIPHYGQPLPPHAFPPHPAQENQQLWQHHHYLHPSQSSVYPQSQDKYLCPTCNKAFSRPSSLRIHSHSHTGEKPYKCAHPGCGKAFSVRSNMKRHERGCHSVNSMGSRPMV